MKTVAALVYLGILAWRSLAPVIVIATILIVALCFSGCSASELPKVLQVQDGFSEAQVEVLHDVRDEWCEATGWCPSFVGWGTQVFAELDMEDCVTCDEKTLGYNDGAHVHLNVGHPGMGDLDRFWYTAAHEFGHWGSGGGVFGAGHTGSGLMAEAYSDASRLCIDSEAVEAFCDESGQCSRREPTCPVSLND
jgi:hypothetical protein